MSYGLINTEILTDIADAIREKLSVQTTYTPSQMADAIASISCGGITPTGTKSITANGTYDVTSYASAEVAVPTEETPTGTKQISITSNGTTTEDVAGYANAEINVNVPTGGGGLEYEEGTFTATEDGLPTISFVNAHATAPALVVFMGTGSYINQIEGITYAYIGLESLFGTGVNISASVNRPAQYTQARISSNGSVSYGSKGIATVTDHVTNTGFNPSFDSTAVMCKAGRTYKWIAIWK